MRVSSSHYSIFKGADRKRAEIEMKEMIELEIQLVGKSADEADRGEPDRGNNPISIKQLKRSYPEVCNSILYCNVVLD